MSLWHKFKNFCNSFYWFYIHKSTVLNYDTDLHKFIKTKKAYRNENILYNWYNGEDDILNIILRKIEQMFWMLKNNASQTYCYLWGGSITKYGSESDKVWAINKILNSKDDSVWLCSSKKTDENGITSNYYFYPKEQCIKELKHYTANEIADKCSELKIKKYYILWNDIEKGYIADSIDGEIDYSIVSEKENAKKFETYPEKFMESWKVIHKQILVPETIYEHSTSPVYRNVEEVVAEYTGKAADDILLNNRDEIIENAYSINVEIRDFTKISSSLKTHLDGAREQCKQLAHLHHLLVKLTNISDLDEKYQPHYSINSTQEEKDKEFDRVSNLYKEDRKKAYRAIADYMAEYGETWWD